LANSRSIREVANGKGMFLHAVLNLYLLIFSDRILDSRVEAGKPNWAAAPAGPETRPAAAASAVSMTCFSCTADFRLVRGADPSESQLESTEKRSDSVTITERSMTFCSSRMFPGHE